VIPAQPGAPVMPRTHTSSVIPAQPAPVRTHDPSSVPPMPARTRDPSSIPPMNVSTPAPPASPAAPAIPMSRHTSPAQFRSDAPTDHGSTNVRAMSTVGLIITIGIVVLLAVGMYLLVKPA
jgi:hypothetical protein